MRLEGEYLDWNPLTLQHAFQVVDGRLLASGRVAGVEANQRLEVVECLGVGPGPVGLPCALPGQQSQEHP